MTVRDCNAKSYSLVVLGQLLEEVLDRSLLPGSRFQASGMVISYSTPGVRKVKYEDSMARDKHTLHPRAPIAFATAMRTTLHLCFAAASALCCSAETIDACGGPIVIEPLNYTCGLNELQAIQTFCGGKATSNDLYVPSPYAADGAQCSKTSVSITGFCDPPMLVPSGLCYFQFVDLCLRGELSGVYGFCQEFKLKAPLL